MSSSDVWKKWEGQVVDHRYQLQRFLGSTDHSVVFLAEFHDPEPKQAAVKFISAEFGNKDEQIAAWKEASNLSHPNLLRIYGAGLCQIEEMSLLYAATEYAEENLSQVLPSRALMGDEASEVLNSVVDVLVYLHSKNLVHGHIKPSNILANGEVLKLSSDTVVPAGEAHEMRRQKSAYDAPELPAKPYTEAADVWSLGVTLVEALTQQYAVMPFNEQADPIIPPAMREPYLEIAQHALRREPRLRWTSARIAERLNPTSATAARTLAAGAGASGRTAMASASNSSIATVIAAGAPPVMAATQVPLSNEPAIPLARQVALVAPAQRARLETPAAAVREEGKPRRETLVLPNYALPLFAGLLVVIALVTLAFVFRHRPAPAASTMASSSAQVTTQPVTTPDSSKIAGVNNAQPVAAPSLPPAKAAVTRPLPVVSTAQPQPSTPALPPATSVPAAPVVAKTSSAAPAKGEVLDKATPDVPAKALTSIHGTVRVGVKVHVDAAGNVSNAALDNAGPSRYFADLSLKAAKQWVFTPPEADGRSVPSDWKIQFHYTQSGVQMSSEQVAP
jgi:TonB family protein